MTALPDDLATVTDAFATGLARADLVVSTGGLGPTPDDLTREAIAAACGETVAVDPEHRGVAARALAAARDGVPGAEPQAGVADPVVRATGQPERHRAGLVRVATGRPGHRRAARPAQARCGRCGPTRSCRGSATAASGRKSASRTYRLTGIGKSQVAELLGESLLRATNPIVATYARVEAVDVRVSAVADGGRSAADLVDAAEAEVLGHVGRFVWAVGETTWSQAIGARLGELGWTLAIVEIGTGGSLNALFADAPWVRFDESIAPEAPAATAHGHGAGRDDDDDGERRGADDLARYAARARELGGAEVGLAVRARPRTGDTAVSIAISTPAATRRVRRVVFLTGPMGRSRAALTAAATLLETLRDDAPAD